MKLRIFCFLVLFLSLGLTFGLARVTEAVSACECENGQKIEVNSCDSCESACINKYNIGEKTCTAGANLQGTATTTADDTPPPGPTVKLNNPLSVDSPTILIGRIIDSILGIVGSLALLMFVFGGLTWMTSSGNQEKVKKGRDIIVWSAIGLAIIFMSYALTRFVLSTITK